MGFWVASLDSSYGKNPTIHFPENKNIVIGGGWKPGWSTDYVATMIAQEYDIKTVINLSNIDYVYTADPKIDKNAVKIKNIDWKNFRKIVGSKWVPGMNKPFDPIASKKAEQLGLKVVIMNGKKLVNLEKFLNGGEFLGTVIE
jgi:uridylate kinase